MTGEETMAGTAKDYGNFIGTGLYIYSLTCKPLVEAEMRGIEINSQLLLQF